MQTTQRLTKFINYDLNVKIALNDLLETHEFRLKAMLLKVYILTFNQTIDIRQRFAQQAADEIISKLVFDSVDNVTKERLLKLFFLSIQGHRYQEADFMKFFSEQNCLISYEDMLNRCYRIGESYLTYWRTNNLIKPSDQQLASKKFNIFKQRLLNDVDAFSIEKTLFKTRSLTEAMHILHVLRVDLSAAIGCMAMLLFSSFEFDIVNTKSPLNLFLVFFSITYLVAEMMIDRDITKTYEKTIKNIPLSLKLVKADKKHQPNLSKKEMSERRPANTELTVDLAIQDYNKKQDVQQDIVSSPSEIEKESKQKKLKRWQLATSTSQAESSSSMTSSSSSSQLYTPQPVDFDERFKELTSEHMTVIDPHNLGKSRHYWGLWNQPAIESSCRCPEDFNNCKKLRDIFKSGELAGKKNSQGFKFIRELGIVEIKSESNSARVFADTDAAFQRGPDRLLEFNQYSRKGKH